jgi:16S rRNA (uracil1498-N3)-methyltransferase
MAAKVSATLPRFLAPALSHAGDEVVLSPEESHHLTRVLRLGAGDRIAVFDGRGREFLARIVRADRSAAVVSLLDAVEPVPEPRVPISIVQSVLKASAMDDVVRDATMIGAASIEPVWTAHVAIRGGIRSKVSFTERWQRIALASVKQCRRAVLPVVHPTRRIEDWLSSTGAELRLLCVEPSTAADARPLRSFVGATSPASAALMIGPEGGWSAAEVKAAMHAGCVPVTLGHLTLRADAVALVAASLIRLIWDD